MAAGHGRLQCLLGLVVIAIGIGRGQTAAQRFYPDDPLLREPTPLPAPDPLRRNLSVVLEALSATFSRDGDRHPGKQVIDGFNTFKVDIHIKMEFHDMFKFFELGTR